MVAGAAEVDLKRGGAPTGAELVAEGSARHPYPNGAALLSGPSARRNLADAVHHLCILHGRFPGVIDLAAEKAEAGAHLWLTSAADAFAEERGWLTRLVVAAGPLPSTPHQAESEAAVGGQRHALEMLARSDRAGCAVGAAVALLLDWRALRHVLDVAGDRFGLPPQRCDLPDAAAVDAFLATSAISPAYTRALRFGAQQILVQHRGLWDLLDAREQARRGH